MVSTGVMGSPQHPAAVLDHARRRRAVRWCALGFAVAAFCGAPAAPAQTEAHVTGSVTAAYTDNAFSAPDNPAPGQRGVVATPFFLLSPGLALYHDRPTSRYAATYQHDFTFFLRSSADNSGSDLLRGQGQFDLSPRDTLGISLNATRSSFTQLVVDADNPGSNETQTGGVAQRLRVDVFETYARELSPRWRLLQSVQVGTLIPFARTEPLRYQGGAELGGEYVRALDTYGLSVGTTYFSSVARDDRPQTLPVTKQMISALKAYWRHEWSPWWSSHLQAGLGLATELGERSRLSPMAAAGISHAGPALFANLDVAHTQTVNLESSQTFISDSATATVGMPLSRGLPLMFNAQTSFGRNRQLVGAGASESANVWLSELRLGYAPRILSVDLRAQHFEQFGSDTAVILPDMTRNVVLITVGGVFPPRAQPWAPRASPRRQSAPSNGEQESTSPRRAGSP